MLTLYVISAIVGGTFVLLSALGGDADGDMDHDFDHDHDLCLDADVDIDADLDMDADLSGDMGDDLVNIDLHGGDVVHADLWIPFLSMRFWTYASTFFGTTGLLLTWVAPIGAVATGLLSAGTGFTTGLGMAYATHKLKQVQVSSRGTVNDLVGTLGCVLVTVRPDEVGKIRVKSRGQELDLIAVTDDDDTLERGSDALIIGFDGPTARVVRASFADNEVTPE